MSSSGTIHPEPNTSNLILLCPHCNKHIIIQKINCGIFRHGVIRTTGKQIRPHASRQTCEALIANDSIYGCGKPFRIIKIKNNYTTEICDYI